MECQAHALEHLEHHLSHSGAGVQVRVAGQAPLTGLGGRGEGELVAVRHPAGGVAAAHQRASARRLHQRHAIVRQAIACGEDETVMSSNPGHIYRRPTAA
jgi:hypothetical protein